MGLLWHCATFVALCFVSHVFHRTDGLPAASRMFMAEFTKANKSKDIYYNVADSSQLYGASEYDGALRLCTDNFEHLLVPEIVIQNLRACCDYILECPNKIAPQTTKYGIENTSDRNILSCECDSSFRDCLNKFPPEFYPLAAEVGKSRYDLYKQQCFLKIYKMSCMRDFFDEKGRKYVDNDEGMYFCPTVRNMAPF